MKDTCRSVNIITPSKCLFEICPVLKMITHGKHRVRYGLIKYKVPLVWRMLHNIVTRYAEIKSLHLELVDQSCELLLLGLVF